MKSKIDTIDLEIIKHLSSNAKISYTDLASRILVSPSTVHVRVKRLEDLGIIKNFTIRIDYSKLGFSFTAYLGVFLDQAKSIDNVVKVLKEIPQITVIDFTTGQFSIFCKVRAMDSAAARKVLKRIHTIDGISRTETFISMEEIINEKDSLIDYMDLNETKG
ncbi:MAG: Lrp/AsnC family transcriptional regulator [Flavobacteriales bacterium]|nr:Lrp/AsnC family transcriptional regulator [Flavobacteriales bacterium]